MFTMKLLRWHRTHNHRSMPWKAERDPYRIWLSEIILQQTRVEQGLPYYLRFTEQYPTVNHLAAASDQEVYALWQGLGYYNRCRNLLATARYIANDLNGVFPSDYEDIRNLKGVGDYTAAAIASFAFKLPYAVVDGNVIRVLSRYFALTDDPYKAAGKKKFQALAQQLLSVKKPDLFNQAIMDLGSTLCKPKKPLCGSCPLHTECLAFNQETIDQFPPPKNRLVLKDRFFHFFLPQQSKNVWLMQRTDNDIWHHLYTPLLVEAEPNQLSSIMMKLLNTVPIPIAEMKQTLSHQRIHGYFYRISGSQQKKLAGKNRLLSVPIKELSKYACPRIVVSFFQKNYYL